MKKILLGAFIALISFCVMTTGSKAQSVSITTDGSTANTSAMLDIKNPNKGLLIPRIALTGTADVATIPSPAVSLLIYNTSTAGSGNTAVVPGFYFWNGSGWLKLNTGATAANIPAGTAIGEMLYWNGTAWAIIPAGQPGQYLQTGQSGLPGWTGTLFATVTTTAATPTTYYDSAVAGGNITNDGGTPVTVRGIVWNTATKPTLANNKTIESGGTGTFQSSMTGLLPSTTYYFRAYATNTLGTTYANELTFTSLASTPATVSTVAVTGITGGAASSGVIVSDEGSSPVTARGICWATTANPTIANNKTVDGQGGGYATSGLGGMTVSTTYYVRAYATNSLGTAYGNAFSFTTTSTFGIGNPHQGGIVAYIFQAGDPGYVTGQTHGIIASVDDLPTPTGPWTNEPVYVSTATDTTYGTALNLGSGRSNTSVIAGQANNTNLAATLCADLVVGGYSDWFLPSKDEMTKMYLNKGAIGNFLSIYYSSSSGYGTAYNTSVSGYHIAFNGPQATNPNAAFWFSGPAGYAVRAARYF